MAVFVADEGQQAITEIEPQLVDLERGRDRLLCRGSVGPGLFFGLGLGLIPRHPAGEVPSQAAGRRGKYGEGGEWDSGEQGK